ncbi:membrane protein implicated in regulation of membrane protease activity [Sphingobium sp. B11D3B]|nr:membrane protein implicated in regulation of membrane protease activity [Sphingobium sp. B11D3B]
MTPMLDGMHPSILWGVFAVILAGAEIIVPGVFLIWLGVAAALTAGLSLVLPINPAFQLLAFAIFTAISVSGGRLWYLARPVASQDPMLNDRAARLVGRELLVVEPINHGVGRVKVDDGSWTATGPDADPGSYVRVTGTKGAALIVEPLPTPLAPPYPARDGKDMPEPE